MTYEDQPHVEISTEAIDTAIDFVRHEKEEAIDKQDFQAAADLRETEKILLAGRALGFLLVADQDRDS
jgi:hypothetical protein